MTSTSNGLLTNESPNVPAWQPLRVVRSRIVSGSLTLLAGSGMVGVANLVYNIAIARLLGPTGFSHATAVYTLLMLMSAVTLSFQIVCAKLVANHESPEGKAAVYVGLHRRAWRVGIAIGLLMVLTRSAISAYLNLPGTVLVVFLAVGTAFYVPLGARRGCMQGTYAFNLLAINLVLEGLVRLGGALLLIQFGMGVKGAVLASVAAVIVSYCFATLGPGLKFVDGLQVPTSFREGLQAIVFFVGQVIINNFDIILVKHFFSSEQAGLYAAIALVGRVVNMCAWSVVSTMFPISAGSRSEEREGTPLLTISLLLVALVLGVLVLGLWMVPDFLWRLTFGAQFEFAGHRVLSSLLILYAVTTGIYSLSAVIIAFEMSRKIANTGWVQLAFSGAVVLGIYFLHASLHQVIQVQLLLMLLLLAVVLLPFLSSNDLLAQTYVLRETGDQIRKRRSLTQPEVVAEFLRTEFHHPEFNAYRDQFARLVMQPDLINEDENALRRALLFLRHGTMWRELPADTHWFEVELTRADLSWLRVFPRAQWRRVAQDSFYLTHVVQRIRSRSENDGDDEFFSKLRLLSNVIHDEGINSTVLLIAVNESSPLTVLDGNHRMAAALLADPSTVPTQFRFLCGFSPRMTECCWYQTNMTTLWRYAKNLLRYLPYDPEADIRRLLQRS